MTDIELAKNALMPSNITCALARGDLVYISELNGVLPMLDFMERGIDLNSFSVADRVVGRAAALLFALNNIREVYAEILSYNAIAILEEFSIKFSYNKLVEYIADRCGNGLCPLEQATLFIGEPNTGYIAIKNKLSQLKQGG